MMIEIALMTRCQDAVDLAVETVAFTKFLFHATREWTTINNPIMAAKVVQSLRTNLKPSGVRLTDQMEHVRNLRQATCQAPARPRQRAAARPLALALLPLRLFLPPLLL